MAAVFGSLNRTPVYHDETAYVLQARIFASGRWTADARPLPEFFEEIHTFATPFVAAKYWPGHSLVLVPGIWLGVPVLMPLLLGAAMGGLLYALSRRVAGSLVAVLTWLVWVSAADTLFFGASYFSELTTGALWLLGWWGLLEWRRTRRQHWLLVLALCLGSGAITRPLTMLAYGLPITLVVLHDVRTRREARALVTPAILVFCCLAIIPVWSARTTGVWHSTPYTLYAQLYLPIDRFGLGTDVSVPARARPWDLEGVSRDLVKVHREHTVGRLPAILAQRSLWIGEGIWGGKRVVLLPFAALSLWVWPAEATVALGSAALLVLVHLLYAYDIGWTVYYFELLPVLAFMTGLGLAVAIRWAIRRIEASSIAVPVKRIGLATVGTLYVLGALLHLAGAAGLARAKHDWLRRPQRALDAAVSKIVQGPAVVFIRYAPDHSPHLSLIDNGPDLDAVRVWTVYDRGEENRRLMRRFPQRAAYLYDEATGRIDRLAS
jgi:hypothetical protein